MTSIIVNNKPIKRLSILLLIIFADISAFSQAPIDSMYLDFVVEDNIPVRPVTSLFSAGIGAAHLLDTYLSPLPYDGTHFSLSWQHFQATGFSPEKWVRQLQFDVDYNITHNPAGNHDNHALLGQAQWALMRQWRDIGSHDLRLAVGGETAIRGGILYTAHNSNNVVSGRVHWNIGATALAVYNFRIKRLPVTLSYQATIPVAGVFYSPDYDETYYEIYLGNHKNLAHFGWWGNRFDMENLVAADLHFGSTIVRIGYRNRFMTSWVNNLSVRERNHSFVIGIGGEILSLGYRKPLPGNAPRLSPLY